MFFKNLSPEEIDRIIARADDYTADGQLGFARLEYIKALRGAEPGHQADEISQKLRAVEQQLVQKNLERYQNFMDAGETASAVEALETALPLAEEGSDQYWNLMKLYEQAESKERLEDLSEELKIWIDQGVEPGVQFADRHRKWLMALTGASPFDDRLDHSETIVSEELLRLYQKVIDEPENADARYNLGLTLAQYGLLQRATAQFQKYVGLKPDDPEGFFILANLQADRGVYEDALVNFEKTLRLSPGYQPAYFYMAEVYEKNDDPDEAARLYRIVAGLDRNSEFAEEARSRLEEVPHR
ncbi:MAG TPA: tetratricopeptide repeat protein [Acidobacteriota bacterium]|jgi:tetratricopeptide (TPR) repeat protein